MDIKILKPGDKVLVECTVQAVFANSKMVMVTTRDCTEGFDAYIDEITTKNDLEVDCISRADAIQAMQDKAKKLTNEDTINGLCGAVAILFDLPSVTPQEPVLDKIRAEIVELTKCPYGTECLGANCPSNTDCMICGDHVIEILDKYRAETEVEDGNDK